MAKTTSANGMGLTSLGGLGKHMSVMYVLVLFVLVTVLVCVYGGLNEHLAHRHLPDTTVHGDLEVDSGIRNSTGEVGCANFTAITADADFTAEYNRTYLITATLTANRTVTLPSPVTKAGTVVKFILGADLADTQDLIIGQGTALGAVAFATGSYTISADVADEGRKGNTLAAAANNTLTIAGDNNGGGGVGSKVVLTSTGSRWFVEADLVPQGTGGVADASAFSTVA